MAYTGTIDLISGIRPKNGGGFPLVNAVDVYIDDETRLTDMLRDILDRIKTLEGGGIPTQATFGTAVFGTAFFA